MSSNSAPTRPISFARLIGTSISARLLIDIGAQMFNPFLPIFAAGLNTDVIVMGRLVALRSFMGLLSPYFGTLADRNGYHRIMLISLLTCAIGMAVVGISSSVVVAAIGMILIGLGIAGFVPTLQAYLGAQLPYEQLGRGIGMLEYSWALTGIIGLSLMGLLIAATNWRTPFFALSAGLVIAFFIFRTLPSSREQAASTLSAQPSLSLRQRIGGFVRIETNAASTYAAIVGTGFLFYGGMQFMIVHGVWFADQYGFGASELGFVALLFGCFDLMGSVSVSLFTDRIGKRRSVILGAIGAIVGYLLIPLFNIAVAPAIFSAALTRGFFEFAIVANISLLSGQSPSQRGKVMTVSAAVTLGCSTIATFTAPALYIQVGISGIAIISAISTAIALLLLLTRINERAEVLPVV